jgi:hypothetical protein
MLHPPRRYQMSFQAREVSASNDESPPTTCPAGVSVRPTWETESACHPAGGGERKMYDSQSP